MCGEVRVYVEQCWVVGNLGYGPCHAVFVDGREYFSRPAPGASTGSAACDHMLLSWRNGRAAALSLKFFYVPPRVAPGAKRPLVQSRYRTPASPQFTACFQIKISAACTQYAQKVSYARERIAPGGATPKQAEVCC